MTKRVKAQVFGHQRRHVELEQGATKGATVGKDLLWPDGTVIKRSEIDNSQVVHPEGGGTIISGGGGGGGGVAVTLWSLILEIPQIIQNLVSLAGTGLVAKISAAGGLAVRTITGSARIAVTNGNAVSGNPTIDLATLADDNTGTPVAITRDAYGRVQGTRPLVAADIPQGNWPTVKNSIEGGEEFTIPTGHQMLVHQVFVFDGGTLTMDGDLIVL